jgi:hypothetical protein
VAPEGPLTVRALEGVQVEGQERELLKLIRHETQDGELEDAVSKAAKALKSTSAKSIRSSEWSEAEGILYFRGKIYVPLTSDICWKIVALNHDSQVAGHPGRWKTLELVSRNYWWPQMSRYIGQYTATCTVGGNSTAGIHFSGSVQPLSRHTPSTVGLLSFDFCMDTSCQKEIIDYELSILLPRPE